MLDFRLKPLYLIIVLGVDSKYNFERNRRYVENS